MCTRKRLFIWKFTHLWQLKERGNNKLLKLLEKAKPKHLMFFYARVFTSLQVRLNTGQEGSRPRGWRCSQSDFSFETRQGHCHFLPLQARPQEVLAVPALERRPGVLCMCQRLCVEGASCSDSVAQGGTENKIARTGSTSFSRKTLRSAPPVTSGTCTGGTRLWWAKRVLHSSPVEGTAATALAFSTASYTKHK